MKPIATEPLFVLTLALGKLVSLGATAQGERRVAAIAGGTRIRREALVAREMSRHLAGIIAHGIRLASPDAAGSEHGVGYPVQIYAPSSLEITAATTMLAPALYITALVFSMSLA